ncbi:uncharacterized protein LOC132293878 [Cornus florida]|uniref:uncharacterized protein LOC132293878 n=1 Tax=Cornus florida TaxID=4283 RepID=UPI002896B313|nr:uncharacterized protein LOC132293878 [Cornus florida]
MATTSTAADQTANSKSVDASLWWDSFSLLLTELENASLSSDLSPNLVEKLKENHSWFLDTVSLFKSPNQKSREALNSRQVNIGSHQLIVQPELRETALKISSILCLDEVQSYILVKRSIECNSLADDPIVQERLYLVVLQYYIERQCLLKCTRQIFMHALYVGSDSKEEGSAIKEEAQKLISDGLENRLLCILEDLLSSSHPEHMDVDLFTLWAEETLIEDNLVLDILFLAYYESFCICKGKHWKKLCLLYGGIMSGTCNFGKLAISAEAMLSIYHAKVQLLLILIETLDLENLLQMIHDEMPFRQGSSAFSVVDVQEMDVIISSLNAFEMKEAGPLILSWAVFLCLVSSLPGKQENNVLLELDHVGYVRQAFEVSSLSYFLEILQTNTLKDSDGPVAGYRSVLRTFVSAFIASYELEDNNFKLILDILCEIYRGEESLCIQFWDRGSFIDGPIRCLLFNLESEFPSRTVELVRLLSALCEGNWPAECVYSYLDKSVGISTLLEMNSDSLVDNISQIVEADLPFHVPGVEGLFIPSRTRGHVLKVIDGNTALVRWEYTQSGVLVLLLRLGQELYLENTEEVLVTLDLLSRLVSFNMAICYTLMEIGNSSHVEASETSVNTEKNVWVNLVEIVCNLVKKLSPSCSGAVLMSMGVTILAKMLKCSPSQVTRTALRANIFDVALGMNPFNFSCDGFSSASWLLSGRLARMLVIDCEHNDSCFPLTLSVLDFTLKLVETGVENDVVLTLVVFSLQYVLVNHEYWKYRVKHVRWKVTLKVLEMIKKCMLTIPYSKKLGVVVRDILLCDSSIHNTLIRIICTTTQALEKLYVSRLYELEEIEGLQRAICSVFNILLSTLTDPRKDILPSLPVFHQAMLSPTTKPVSVVTAVISLISFFRNPEIQVGAARVLSMLFVIADNSLPYVFGNACFGLDNKQITDFRHSVESILGEQSLWNEALFVATLQLLTSAALYQPAFLVAVIGAKENTNVQLGDADGVKRLNEATSGSLWSKDVNLIDALLQYIGRSDDLIESNPRVLLNALNFLKALWQGAGQFTIILDWLKSSKNFWRKLSRSILLMANVQSKIPTDMEIVSQTYRYQCQSAVLQILAYEVFLQKKLLHADSLLKQPSELSKDCIQRTDGTEKTEGGLHGLKDILSTCCESSVLGNLIKSFASYECGSDKYLRVKIAAGLFAVLVMGKLKDGDMGSLSVSLIEKIDILSNKLSNLPAFSELLAQYTQRGYSEGNELNRLILSDLYYHLQGELEGREIDPGPFKELSQYLIDYNFLQTYQCKYEGDLFAHAKDVYLFDSTRLQEDLGLDVWDYSGWKASKEVAETMLLWLHDVNSTVLLASSKLSALKALTTILSVYDADSTEKHTTIGRKIPEQLLLTCIDHICQCLHVTIESLAPVLDASEDTLDFLAAQAELLLHLIRSGYKKFPLAACVLVLKTSAFCLKVLSNFKRSVAGVRATVQLLLALLLSSVGLSCMNSLLGGVMEMESVEAFAEASNASLGLLPILCNCIEPAEHCTLSLAIIDLILKSFLTPNTWFPIIQKHLQLQHVVQKLQDKNSFASIPVILKFLLTLARVRGGADMLLTAGFFPSLRVLFADLSDGRPSSVIQKEKNLSCSGKIENPQHFWGLGLAVVTAMIQSLGDSSSCTDLVDNVITYLFSEKTNLISYYLNAPDFPSDDHDKKRARAQKTQTYLSALKETEHTLMLLGVLVKHRNSWIKAMKETDSLLRERSIHLLAFISRGTQRIGESPNRIAPLLCHPVLKEEFEWYKKPSFVNSRNGWFALSPLGCMLNPKFSAVLSGTNALVIKDQATELTDPAPQTYFSDITAIQIYRLAFLLLKFLCLQAEGAAKRADDVGFVDLARFPELPMPDILHGLQDQAIAIVNELCETNKLKQVSPEIEDLCVLMLQIMEMSLYLELCVSNICGIRPVLGRVEDFLKGLKSLTRVTEGHAFLRASVKSLKQIISFVYPGLLQTEGIL